VISCLHMGLEQKRQNRQRTSVIDLDTKRNNCRRRVHWGVITNVCGPGSLLLFFYPFVASSSNAKGLGLLFFVSVPKAFHSLQCTVSPHSTGNLCVAVILHCCSCALVTFYWSLLDDIAVQALLACFAVQFTVLSSWGLQKWFVSCCRAHRWGVPRH